MQRQRAAAVVDDDFSAQLYAILSAFSRAYLLVFSNPFELILSERTHAAIGVACRGPVPAYIANVDRQSSPQKPDAYAESVLPAVSTLVKDRQSRPARQNRFPLDPNEL